MIPGRTFIATSAIGIPFAPLAVEGQQTAKAYLIGWFVTAPLSTAVHLRLGDTGPPTAVLRAEGVI